MTVRELRNLIADLDDRAIVLTSGVEIAQAVVTENRSLILEMDPEYEHDGTVVWRGLNA
jgi:hypothetical protein